MKKILNNIIINFSILMYLGGCHTLEHKKLFIENNNKNIINNEVKSQTTPAQEEIIPVIKPTKKEIMPIIREKKINLESLINFSENQLYFKIGKGDFIKKEGQLKNIQYYFSKCFLDVFLIRRNREFHVSFIQIRSTILNGSFNKDECLDEISSKLKTNFN